MAEEKGNELIRTGKLEIITITEDLYDEAIELHKEYFIKEESLNKACGTIECKETVAEIAARQSNFLRIGICFAVRHCESGKLVAICINSIGQSSQCKPIKSARLKCIVEIMARCKQSFDVLKEWNIDCALEIVCLATHRDYAGLGLATILAKHAINCARQMLHGTLIDRDSLPAHVRDLKPKALFCILTSLFTQKLFAKIGMETVQKIPYSELYYEGKSFAEKIEPIHEYLTLAVMRL